MRFKRKQVKSNIYLSSYQRCWRSLFHFSLPFQVILIFLDFRCRLNNRLWNVMLRYISGKFISQGCPSEMCWDYNTNTGTCEFREQCLELKCPRWVFNVRHWISGPFCQICHAFWDFSVQPDHWNPELTFRPRWPWS